MSKFNAKAICRIAALAALYFLLNMVSIKAGNLRITFASLPVVVSALLFGPLESVLVALFGELLNQLLSYGLTATTLLWLVPPAVRGLTVGLLAARLWRTGHPLETRPVLCYGICVLAALCTTVANTLIIWLDSVLLHYYSAAYVFGQLFYRLGSGVVIAVIIATVAMPLAGLLRRQGIARRV